MYAYKYFNIQRKIHAFMATIYYIYTATIDTPLLASSLDAGVRGHPGVKEHTDHKPRNALTGGSVSTRLLENAQCIKAAVDIAPFFLVF